MDANHNSKLRGLFNNWYLVLILITAIAIIIRSIPAWTNAAWGCDFGIYYGLSKAFVESGGELFNPYTGWGFSYNYFPVLYAVTGFAHWITGIEIIVLMPKLIPIFGGLTVLIFYFVINSLIKDREISLLSCLFLSVLPFHVYQTSHASPLTMGHFFMMLSLLFFIKFRQKFWYFFPLIISTLLLIMSHHLTTYFYLITLLFIVFFENASKNEWTPWLKKDIIYVLFSSGLVFSYWAFIAIPVFEGFMGRGLSLGFISIKSSFIVLFFYILFFLSFGIVSLIRKYNKYILNHNQITKGSYKKYFLLFIIKINPFIKKKQRSVKSRVLLFLFTLLICYNIMIIFSIIKMPWTNFSFKPYAVVLSTPILLVFAFWIAGFRDLWYIRNGNFIRGWMIALTASLLYAIFTDNTAILPHRHMEYMMYPLAIITVYGIRGIFLNIDYEKLSKKVKKHLHISISAKRATGKEIYTKRKHIIYSSVIFFVIVINAFSVYEVHKALEQSDERITAEDISVIEWMSENLDKNTSVIASDHRLERMAEAEGFNTSMDNIFFLWKNPKDDTTNYFIELFGIGKNYTEDYSRITHIIIDDIMKDVVVHWGRKKEVVYMTEESYRKFNETDFFKLLYKSESEVGPDGKVEHWAAVYKVNWDYFWEEAGLKYG